MQEIEARAFAAGVSADSLMEQAGDGIARAIRQFHPRPGLAVLYLGKGNNAGDALVAARHLHAHGWRLLARPSAPVSALKPLPLRHLQTLGDQLPLRQEPLTAGDLPPGPLILIDGLLGIGASGPLQAPLAGLAAEMNRLRRQAHASTIALDLPSGLDADSGQPGPDTVQADLTLTIGHVKTGLVADSAINHTGRLALIPLPGLQSAARSAARSAAFQAVNGPRASSPPELLTPALLRPLLPRRDFDTHKGQTGRLLIAAGSPGFLGAAELACRGALQTGAGLVTLLVKPDTLPLLAARVPAEIMVKAVPDYNEALHLPHDALVIGPGLGRSADEEIRRLLAAAPAPAVVDADALNALAPLPPDLAAPGPRLLTPHPGEWRRLAPDLADPTRDRRQQAEAFAAAHPDFTLLLKGARTVIAHRSRPTRFNSTGHPGMATGGMGDVLSGVLGALLGQGIPAPDSAALGAWLCGRAAERAALDGHPCGALPTAVANHLGNALLDLSEGCY